MLSAIGVNSRQNPNHAAEADHKNKLGDRNIEQMGGLRREVSVNPLLMFDPPTAILFIACLVSLRFSRFGFRPMVVQVAVLIEVLSSLVLCYKRLTNGNYSVSDMVEEYQTGMMFSAVVLAYGFREVDDPFQRLLPFLPMFLYILISMVMIVGFEYGYIIRS